MSSAVRRPIRRTMLVLSAVLLLVPAMVTVATAAEPDEGTIGAGNTSLRWAGKEYTAAAMPGPTTGSDQCPPAEADQRNQVCDHFSLTVDVEPGYWLTHDGGATVTISWENSSDDFDLYAERNGQDVAASASGGTTSESLMIPEASGTYEIKVVPFLVDHSGYQGEATFVSKKPQEEQSLPAAPNRGLEFSASVPADIQRDEGEPMVRIDDKGRVYTCGPTGFSQTNDYAQVSTDGGEQFHLLGEPPRGQISVGEGGGDCAIATAPQRNSSGNYQLAYAGLGPLTNFSTATSSDGGHTLTGSPVSESIPGVDRQWIAFSDSDTVFLNYNQLFTSPQAPGDVAVTVQRSDDGGLTYGPPKATSEGSSVVGQIRTMPAEVNPRGNGKPVVYYPWVSGNKLMLGVSLDHGATFHNCLVHRADDDPAAIFPAAEHDSAGNIYYVWTEKGEFHTYMNSLTTKELLDCRGGTAPETPGTFDPGNDPFDADPGFSPPVQVDREGVRSTAMPWVTAGPEPGRVAVTFYGSEADGDPESSEFQGAWNVYVNQSLRALHPRPRFSQVRATTHPNHYDQICLGGLACSSGGDRSLVDLFAIEHNPANGELVLVFNRAHKRPSDTAGTVSSPIVVHQIAGPSNGGGRVGSGDGPVVRTSSDDPAGDALADYSSLYTAPSPANVPAADLRGHEVGPYTNLENGAVNTEDGGFTVTMRVSDLSDAALQQALSDTQAQSLVWAFRFVDGYRYSAASARWSPSTGFTFGFNGYVDSGNDCGPSDTGGGQCLLYPGATQIQGQVDQQAGTITLSVPGVMLEGLEGEPDGPDNVPEEIQAEPGTRMYDAAAFSLTNPASPTQDVQSFLYPLDNTPAMDFLVPGATSRN